MVDHGVLTLKPGVLPVDQISSVPHAVPSHPAIVEWRAMTVIELYVFLFSSNVVESIREKPSPIG